MSDNTNIEEYLKNAQAGLLKITECVESAKAAAMEAAESQGLTTTALADARIKLIEITATATQALAAKTQITDEQAVIATKSIHIQKAQEYGDKVRADLDGELTLAKQQVTATEAQRLKAQSAAENADKLLAAIQTAKGSLETDVATVVTARKTAEESAALTKGLADKSATVEERIAAYEKRLAELDTQAAVLRSAGQNSEKLKAEIRASLREVETMDIDKIVREAMESVNPDKIAAELREAQASLARVRSRLRRS